MSSVSKPPKLTNLYHQRLAGTEKPCWVCLRPSATVLSSVSCPNEDFIYVCLSHLSDRNFASPFVDPGAQKDDGPALKERVGEEEIQKVKEEWEARQKEKEKKAKEKEKEKEKGKEGKEEGDSKGGKGEDKGKDKTSKVSKSPSPTAVSPTPAPSRPPQVQGGHKKFTLHRDFFAMRQSAIKKKYAAAQAQIKAAPMPKAPVVFPSIPKSDP